MARAVAAVDEVATSTVVVTGGDDGLGSALAGHPQVRIVTDRRPGEGPLAGLEAALLAADEDLVLVLAGDHPHVVPDVLRLLVDRLTTTPDADAAALVTAHGTQPLVAAYRRTALPIVSELLDAGERRARALLPRLEVVLVEPADWASLDPEGATAVDVDTPDDLAAATGRRATRVTVVEVDDGAARRRDDVVVAEEPLEVRACGPDQAPVTVVTTLRTPGNDADLAVGWLHAEGLAAPGEVVRIEIGDPLALARPDDQVTVHLSRALDLDAVAHRHTTATASCGVCGRATIDELAARCAPVPASAPRGEVPWTTLAALPDRLREHQQVFAATGGLHATGIADLDGRLVTVREDVGRHNALDAAIGHHVRAGTVPLNDHLGVLSGRVGFELVAKAAVAGLPVLAAVGAATDLAVRTADRLGVTLVAFVRGGRGIVLTHPDRLTIDAPRP